MRNLLQIVIQGRHGVHIFKNLPTLKWLLIKLTGDFRNRDSYNLAASKYLFQQLQDCSFKQAWVTTITDPQYFRRVGHGRDALDIAGSLSDGGRHNIGGAQSSSDVSSFFSPIGGKRGVLYLGEDPRIVRKEFGDEAAKGSRAITYSVNLRGRNKSLQLVDASLALQDLSKIIPDISNLVGTASMSGKWVDLKQPTPSQIFGHWLIHNAPQKTAGIRFPTAHGGASWNVCLFFHDSNACKKTLKVTKLP